jgi:hypothetical protein
MAETIACGLLKWELKKAQRDKETKAQREEGEKDTGEWVFCFVPLCLCPYVPGII